MLSNINTIVPKKVKIYNNLATFKNKKFSPVFLVYEI